MVLFLMSARRQLRTNLPGKLLQSRSGPQDRSLPARTAPLTHHEALACQHSTRYISRLLPSSGTCISPQAATVWEASWEAAVEQTSPFHLGHCAQRL